MFEEYGHAQTMEMLEIIKFNFLIYIDYLKYILLNIIAHNDKYKLFMKHKRMVVI